jgi:hypothetical protein
MQSLIEQTLKSSKARSEVEAVRMADHLWMTTGGAEGVGDQPRRTLMTETPLLLISIPISVLLRKSRTTRTSRMGPHPRSSIAAIPGDHHHRVRTSLLVGRHLLLKAALATATGRVKDNSIRTNNIQDRIAIMGQETAVMTMMIIGTETLTGTRGENEMIIAAHIPTNTRGRIGNLYWAACSGGC